MGKSKMQIQTVEKIVEVPQVQTLERVVPVPQTQIQEMVRQFNRVPVQVLLSLYVAELSQLGFL